LFLLSKNFIFQKVKMANAPDPEAVPLAMQNNKLERSHELPFDTYHAVGKEGSKTANPPAFFGAETGQAPTDFPSQEINWNGPYDELNPMNWPSGKKWRSLGVISLVAFITLVFKAFSKLNR
jgi:hypothetical protein